MKPSKKWRFLIPAIWIIALSIGWGLIKEPIAKSYYFPSIEKQDDSGTTDLSALAIEKDESYEYYGEGHSNHEGETNYTDRDIKVDDSFSTRLPLVIIDTNDILPQKYTSWDDEKHYSVSMVDDPFVNGTITIIDNKTGLNSAADAPSAYSEMRMRVRGNSSSAYDKKQWLIKLQKNGKNNKENLLNLGSDSEWILNISFIDKSLLRNYLAYTAANEIMGYAPGAEYCEVLWKNGDEYSYRGVYLLMHSVKAGKSRVNLGNYSLNSEVIPALLRRDRYNENDIILENYGTVNGLTDNYIGLIYPDKNTISQSSVDKITKIIDNFEKALFSEDYTQFIEYRNYIDVDSFVDYFVINEFFMNYDAGYDSTYFYIDAGGLIHMGPVWDFDQGIDNSAEHIAKETTTAFHDAPWFRQLLKDPEFTEKIITRYSELRASILSDESIEAYVCDISEFLGTAAERDWARWGYYYTTASLTETEDSTSSRNTDSYDEEIKRILNTLSKHAEWLDENIDSLYQFKMISLEHAKTLNAQTKTDYRPMLAVVYVILFILSIQLVLRYENEN